MMSKAAAGMRRSLAALLGATGDPSIDIRGLTADSREVSPGYLFAALPGARADGRHFIPQALEKGAVALLVPSGSELDAAATIVEDRVPRRRLAEMAARFFDAQPETLVAVTGTNGKTSVASFTRQIWAGLGYRAGSIGTLGVEGPGVGRPGNLTSPDPVTLHRALAELAAAGIDHAAIEASSHGLSQYRVEGVRMSAAAFTNLSRDHLDYHITVESYFYAKARLFTELLEPGAAAVVDVNGPFGRRMADLATGRRLRTLLVGRAEDADIRLADQRLRDDGQWLAVHCEGREFAIDLPLAGAFQADNALVAAGLAIACGAPAGDVLPGLAALEPVPGRLEKVGKTPDGAGVYIDYAHTPAGLETVLAALRPHTRGRLVVVFGCGGDRDRGKRAEMGAIAARDADRIYVTDDNPRSEDPAAIRAAIRAACPQATDIGDRREAIMAAVSGLAEGDCLVIAGKGHEEGQIVGDRVHAFSDLEVAGMAIREAAS